MLQLSLNFVRALVKASPDSKLGNVAQLVQQVFVGADFSEGEELGRIFSISVHFQCTYLLKYNLHGFTGDFGAIFVKF